MSTPSDATKVLTRRQYIPANTDDQLERRSKVGNKIKQAFKKAGSAIKKGFQKVGSAVKSAVKKVGTFVKTTGAKIAKFGLKVVQSVGTMVGKVAGYIPAIGKPIDKAIEGVSKVAGVVSDHIHAKLSSKLQKGMNVMNKADKIMDYIPRRREFSEEEAFQQRSDHKLPSKLQQGMNVMNTANRVLAYIPRRREFSEEETFQQRSDHKLPSRLQQGMNAMNTANQIFAYIPRRREFSEEEAFQQRDISEGYYFEERDDIALEGREDSYFEGNERDIYERYDLEEE